MKDTSKYVPLETVVKNYMSEAQLTGAHYLRLYQLSVRGLTELGMDITEEPKTEKLDVEANKTVYIPDDYIQWVKVGIMNENGEVATLRRNDSLTLHASLDADRLTQNTGTTGSVYLPMCTYQNYYTGGAMYNVFGNRSNVEYNGSFKVDDANGIILLDNDFAYDHIILEYLCNPAMSDNLVIPVQAQEALIAFLAWMDIRSMPYSRRVTLADKQTRRKEYYNQRRLARERINPLRLWDYNETIRINNNLVLKA